MRQIFNVVIFFAFFTSISACTKKTEIISVLAEEPIDSISKITGVKQWKGQYSHEVFDSNVKYIRLIQSDTSMSFALTAINDSVILCSIFNIVDTLFYYQTNEIGKYILYDGPEFYFGNNSVGDITIIYYYAKNKVDFELDGSDSSGLSLSLKLSIP